MHNRPTKNMYIFALLLFLGGVSYLIIISFSQNSVYFLNVSEAVTMPPEKLRSARLSGIVTQEHITITEKGQILSFQLQDKDNPSKTLNVLYKGIIPDTFRSGAEAIVEGSLSADGTFNAKTLMTKCPSRYEKERSIDG